MAERRGASENKGRFLLPIDQAWRKEDGGTCPWVRSWFSLQFLKGKPGNERRKRVLVQVVVWFVA